MRSAGGGGGRVTLVFSIRVLLADLTVSGSTSQPTQHFLRYGATSKVRPWEAHR